MEEQIRPEDKMIEDGIKVSDKEIRAVGDVYQHYYKWRSYRSGLVRMFQNYNFEEYLKTSRELFWNSVETGSTDLQPLGLNFSIGFARKESMDFLAKLTSLRVKPKLTGDDLESIGVKMLQGMYKKWAFHNNEKVETFFELLYGIVNGTVCSYIGFNNEERQQRYLSSYNGETGDYKIRTEKNKPWNDVTKEVVPIENIYLPKIFERNLQKQGKMIWREQLDTWDFHEQYDKYPMAKYVLPGMRIAEDSLYFRLLGGTGTSTANKIEVMKFYDWMKDEYIIIAGGVVLNKLGKGDNIEFAPMPFEHKMAPFTWGILNPLDEKLAYGLSTPFLVKDPHKILNTSYCVTPDTKILTRDLRWVEAGTLKIGDELVGFEEQGKENKDKKTGRGSRRQRHYEDATVTNTGREVAPVYKVTLEDGTELKCTGNHRWLTWNWKGHEVDWVRADEMTKLMEKRPNGVYLPRYFDVIKQDFSYESGYLSGLFDGEGSLALGISGDKVSRGVQFVFSQQDNDAMKNGIKFLEKKGYSVVVNARKPQREDLESCNQIYVRGGFWEVMRFLMETRPERIINKRWGSKKISDMILQKKSLVKVVSAEYIGEQEIITLESSSKTYIAEGFGAHNTMMVERELRAIDPPILTSDIESPELIFGQHKVIPVNDVNAYKDFQLREPSSQFFTMQNSLQGLMSSHAQGGDARIVPSRQPDSARAVMEDSELQKQNTSNALAMYYNILRQRILLVLKTALQFYPLEKYEADKRIFKSITVPDMALSQGGIGNMEIRFVKEKQSDYDMMIEAIKKSAENGKPTEIVEVPIESIKNLEFMINEVELEPEISSDLELRNFVENVITPMIQIYTPMGLADPAKVMLRHLEKMKESPSDFLKDQSQVAQQAAPSQAQPTGMESMMGGQAGNSAFAGNMKQMTTGIKFGANQSGPLPIAK